MSSQVQRSKAVEMCQFEADEWLAEADLWRLGEARALVDELPKNWCKKIIGIDEAHQKSNRLTSTLRKLDVHAATVNASWVMLCLLSGPWSSVSWMESFVQANWKFRLSTLLKRCLSFIFS